MEKEELAALASQLRHPSGEKGIEIAQMMHETNIGMTKNAISNLNLTSGDSILELGHGNADHLKSLIFLYDEMIYTGLEISHLMNQKAKELNSGLVHSQKAEFVLYDGKTIPFSDNQFDKLFTVNTLYFWDNPSELLAELSRVLKPKALFSLTFAHRSFMETLPFTPFGFKLYNPDEAIELVNQSSFILKQEDQQKEVVMTKDGRSVERKFSTLLLENTH